MAFSGLAPSDFLRSTILCINVATEGEGVDPVTLTLGGIVAGLIAKVLDKGEDKAADQGWAVLGRLVGAVRRRFKEHGSHQDNEALAGVEDTPDSPRRLQTLASAIDRHAGGDQAWRDEVQTLVEEAKLGGVDVGSLTQSAWGDHNVQIGGVSGSSIAITKP
jgi:hypothetical protein